MRGSVNVLRLGRLLRWGALLTLLLAFAAGIGAPPMLWLEGIGFRQLFAVGFCGSLALILSGLAASGSWSTLVDALLKPGARAHPSLAAVCLLFLCLIWGANTFLLAGLLARMTASEPAFIEARYLAVQRSRNCKRLADFSTPYGVVDVCLPHGSHEVRPRTPAPHTLREGEVVLLQGRRNGIVFVVDAVLRRR